MTPTGRMTNLAPGNGGVERDPKTLPNHLFCDGSQEEMLRGCLRATVDFRQAANGVRATVRLWAEGSGHRVPTGFIDRHLILTVEGEDAAGKPVAVRDGPLLPAAAGKDREGKRRQAVRQASARFRRPQPGAILAGRPRRDRHPPGTRPARRNGV